MSRKRIIIIAELVILLIIIAAASYRLRNGVKKDAPSVSSASDISAAESSDSDNLLAYAKVYCG